MMKILFYIHGGNLNRGCEAIITSTAKLIKDLNDNSNITIATQYYNSDIKRCIKNIDRYIPSEHSPNKYSPERIYRFILRKTGLDKLNIKTVYKNTIKEIKKSDVNFVIGGDTYFKDYGMVDTLYTLNSIARKKDKKNVLWCCSIEKDEIDEKMKKDLAEFDLIVARESITLNNLKEKGISENVVLYPDPAFTMDAEKVELPVGWKKEKTIIINTSPLITKFENKPNILMESVQALVEYILENTDNTVALLPHVDNDIITNTKVYEKFKTNNRVINIEFGYSAPQLKYIISQGIMLVAARTHASIAAYSSCVPTLVIGYSVKSLGIARDIFGSEKNMVIPINKLKEKEELITAFNKIYGNEAEVRGYLKEKMPSYIESTLKVKDEINNILELKDKR